MNEKIRYIHYGHETFDSTKFKKTFNDPELTKPIGGLWGCRVNANYGWKEFCQGLGWNEKIKSSFIFSLHKDSKVLVIDNCEQLKNLPKRKGVVGFWEYLDFIRLSKEYDAIEVLISKDDDLRFKLIGWDCDSIVVTNPDVVIIEGSK